MTDRDFAYAEALSVNSNRELGPEALPHILPLICNELSCITPDQLVRSRNVVKIW